MSIEAVKIQEVKTIEVRMDSTNLDRLVNELQFDRLFDYDVQRPHLVSSHNLRYQLDMDDIAKDVAAFVEGLLDTYAPCNFVFSDKNYDSVD